MSSEADLDAEVKALSILSEHPDLYEEFSKLGCVASLVSLLSHENTDIAIDAIEIINELTDEDVEAEQVQWDTLVDALVRVLIIISNEPNADGCSSMRISLTFCTKTSSEWTRRTSQTEQVFTTC